MIGRVRGLAAAAVTTAILLACVAPGAGAQEQGSASSTLFGIGDSSSLYPFEGSAGSERLAELKAGAGAEVARFTLRWEIVQPTDQRRGPNRYRWEQYDEYVTELREAGLRPLPMLLGAPSWARAERHRSCQDQVCPPRFGEMREFARLARAVARRYPDSAGIEIWNEPNLAYYWGGRPDPVAYARMYRLARKKIRKLTRSIPMVSAGLSPVLEGNRSRFSVEDYLREMYAKLGRGLGPGGRLGIHAYPGPGEVRSSQPGGRFAGALLQARRVRGDLDRGRKLWVTEYGSSTTRGERSGLGPESDQASIVGEMTRRLFAADDVEVAILYTMIERPEGTGIEQGYGLVGPGPGFELKQSYCAIASFRGAELPPGCVVAIGAQGIEAAAAAIFEIDSSRARDSPRTTGVSSGAE